MTIRATHIRVEVGALPKKKVTGIIYFKDFQSMNEVLTPNRIELLELIRREKPESIYQLAILAKRDQGNVTKDVAILEKHGFIEVKTKNEGKRMKSEPSVESDTIEMIIKLGVGTFGMAKDAAKQLKAELEDSKMEENKRYAKKTYANAATTISNATKAFVNELKK